MSSSIQRFLPVLFVALTSLATHSALATSMTYAGTGGAAFNGAVGDGVLTVSDDGTGGVTFSLALGNGQTGFQGNDFVIYLDNGTGGGIGTTAGLTDHADGGRAAISETSTSGTSTLNFNSVFAPQYAIDMEAGFGDIFQINGDPSNFTFIDGNGPGSGPSGIGANYTFANGVATLDLPAVDFGLSSFSGATLTFFGIQVSETGYSSSEVIGTVTGNAGFGNTQNVASANTFTTAGAIPEASSFGYLACGAGVLMLLGRRIARLA